MRVILAACLLAQFFFSTAAAQTAHVGNAVRLMQDRRYSEAAAEFDLALTDEPNNVPLRIQYATCLFAQERNDDARRQFEMVRQRVGDSPGISYYLGILDLRANDFTVAAIQKLQPRRIQSRIR